MISLTEGTCKIFKMQNLLVWNKHTLMHSVQKMRNLKHNLKINFPSA